MGGKPGMMTPEQTHVYIWLLCLDWNQGGFAFDAAVLARWCRVTPTIFRRAWTVVQECFTFREGVWFNERLEKERAKQAEWREKSAKGGKTKRQPNDNHPSENEATKREPKGNIPLPVSVTSLQFSVTTTSSPSSAHEALACRLPETHRLDLSRLLLRVESPESWIAEMAASLDGMHGPVLTPDQLGQAIRDYSGNGAEPNMRLFRGYLRDAAKPVAERQAASYGQHRRLAPGERTKANISAMLGKVSP